MGRIVPGPIGKPVHKSQMRRDRMDRESEQHEEAEPSRDITGPGVPAGEATHPPGNGTIDEAAVRAGQEKLEQAAGSD